ncbi:MAG: hypothetical protein EAY72_11930, partial [Bacteroidetes bacterium]
MPLFFSCASYNTKLSRYYSQVRTNNFEAADKELEASNFLRADRNRLLYLLEKGKLLHLQKKYDSSNIYFNAADQFFETENKNIGDYTAGLLTTPMNQKYLGEYFERYMMHYYKALNYMALGNVSGARVEARRITLSANDIADDKRYNTRKYTKDAFAFNLQGLLYEANGDINDAFISYRNSVDLYLKGKLEFYGVAVPPQLQMDLLRTAQQLGFEDQVDKYRRELQFTKPIDKPAAAELVIFLEQGFGPVKGETTLNLIRVGNTSMFSYVDAFGNAIDIPFSWGWYTGNVGMVDAGNVRNMRVALPTYILQSQFQKFPTVYVNGLTVQPQMVQNINKLAVACLQERLLKEIADAMARQLVKIGMEKGVSSATTAISKNNNNGKTDSDKKAKAEAAGALAGLLVNIVNNVTEKADT